MGCREGKWRQKNQYHHFESLPKKPYSLPFICCCCCCCYIYFVALSVNLELEITDCINLFYEQTWYPATLVKPGILPSLSFLLHYTSLTVTKDPCHVNRRHWNSSRVSPQCGLIFRNCSKSVALKIGLFFFSGGVGLAWWESKNKWSL